MYTKSGGQFCSEDFSVLLSSGLHGSWWDICSHWLVSHIHNMSFSLAVFNVLVFLVFCFCPFDYDLLVFTEFVFILLGIHWWFWICKYISFTKCRKFSPLFLQILFLHWFLLILRSQWLKCPFLNIP